MPAVVVHGAGQAEAALTAADARGVLLLSAPGAGSFAGAAWFVALVRTAAARHPAVRHQAALDCADAAGTALAALRDGARIIVLDGACPAFPAVAAAAEEAGATLLPARPPALDLAMLDLARRDDLAKLRAWLAIEAPQAPATPPAP